MNSNPDNAHFISVIVPTIGRPESLAALLTSLANQKRRPDEVIVADGSSTDEISTMLKQPDLHHLGFNIHTIRVSPPNAVSQRQAAIRLAKGDLYLFLDDDVVLEPDCLASMENLLDERPEVSAVTADFSNQSWSNPTTLWRCYMRIFHGVKRGEWQGRVIGPLLRFGYNPSPSEPMPMEWLATCNSLARRSAYEAAGGFSDFFLHRCTMNEDVDLGLKISRLGPILLHPGARLAHHHAPGGRVSVRDAAEDDIFNRYMVLRRTCNYTQLNACFLATTYAVLEIFSNLLGGLRRWRLSGFLPRSQGRLKGLARAFRQTESTNSES